MLIVLVVLHVAAILYYVHAKKDNLVKPMITGTKAVSDPAAESARGGGPVAFVVALAITPKTARAMVFFMFASRVLVQSKARARRVPDPPATAPTM